MRSRDTFSEYVLVSKIPDLSFPMVQFGEKQKAWDLSNLIFSNGNPQNPKRDMEISDLSVNEVERLHLLEKIHSEMSADLVAGGSRRTAEGRYYQLRKFLRWCDSTSNVVSLSTVISCFFRWVDSLRERSRQGYIKDNTVISDCCRVSVLLDKVLGRSRPLLKEVQVNKRRIANPMRIVVGDGLITTRLRDFGELLRNLSEIFSTEKIRENKPLTLSLNNGTHAFCDAPAVELECLTSKRITARSLRAPAFLTQIINIRIEAELLIFISQTAMNLAEAYALCAGEYRYASFNNGYRVYSYKNRRKGEVLFEFFSEYRYFFDEYLTWRKDWCDPEDYRLFPIIRGLGVDRAPEFARIRRICKALSITYYGPRALRKTRQNWFLSEGYAVENVADMGQHSVATLLRYYEKPNPQLALVELSNYHRQQDEVIMSVGPGACSTIHQPEPVKMSLSSSIEPDCVNPSGCLFCVKHRDLDSSDHFWSLATFRFLKSLELTTYALYVPSQVVEEKIMPADTVINRITEKLDWFKSLDSTRYAWVKEALAKVEEGYYHPAWNGFIRLREIEGEQRE